MNTVICDHGTGYTKLGFAGQKLPSFIIPTVTTNDKPKNNKLLNDLDYLSADAALDSGRTLCYPITQGQILYWDQLEQYEHDCFYNYLHIDPRLHNILLTEPPMNTPENREQLAELMFEVFGFKGMFIATQALLAIISKAWDDVNKLSYTGICLDIGDGVSHAIPVYECYTIDNAIKSVPIAGRVLTTFISDIIMKREKLPNTNMNNKIARQIKETLCYCQQGNFVDEFNNFKPILGHDILGTKVDIGPETFIAPEIFFDPNIYSA